MSDTTPTVENSVALVPKLDDGIEQVKSLIAIRKLVNNTQNNTITTALIDAGAVDKCIALLVSGATAEVKYEAAWALTGFCAGTSEHTKAVVKAGAVEAMNGAIAAGADPDLTEQCIWAIGNIAGDSATMRDYVLKSGTLSHVLKVIVSNPKNSTLRNATWTLSNMMRGKPSVDMVYITQAIPVLAQLLYSSDEEVLTDALWATSYSSDGPSERIEAIVQAGLARRLIELLCHPSHSVQTPALRTVGNIVTGDDNHTDTILKAGVLPALQPILSSTKKSLRKEGCWTLSNIAAGNQQQIQLLLNTEALMERLVKIVSTEDFDVKKEAAWTLSNITSGGSPEQIQILVTKYNALPHLCKLLSVKDMKIVHVVAESIRNILRAGEDLTKKSMPNPFALIMEDCSAREIIEAMADDERYSDEILELGLSIIEYLDEADKIVTVFKSLNIKSREKYLDVRIETQLFKKPTTSTPSNDA